MNVAMAPGDVSTWQPLLAVLHLLVLVLLPVLLVAWTGREERRRFTASLLGSAGAVVLAYAALVRPADIPTDWITVIQESLGRKTIMHLYARGAHVGPNFPFVLGLATDSGTSLREVVWLNLLLGAVNALVFLHLAVRTAGMLWGTLWALAYALNPMQFLTYFSEQPTGLLNLYFFAGVLGWETLNELPERRRVLRAAAFLFCAALTFLVALTRFEVAIIGVVALSLHVLRAVLPFYRRSAWVRSLGEAGERLVLFASDHPLVFVALCLLGVRFSLAGIAVLPDWIGGRGMLSGLYPFSASILSLFVFIPMLALPLGVALGILLGSVEACRRFLRFGGLVLSLFIVVRAYLAAQNQFHEMGRYLSHVSPAIFLLGLFARDGFDAISTHWRPIVRRAVYLLYLMTWFTLPPPGVQEIHLRPDLDLRNGISQLLLERNTQREVRHLVTLVETNPACVFVARAVRDDRGDFQKDTRYVYVLFGGPIGLPVVVPEDGEPLAAILGRLVPDAMCVRLYFGGDCNLTFTDRCEGFVAGHRRVAETRFWSRPYNNVFNSGYAAPEVVLATYEWP